MKWTSLLAILNQRHLNDLYFLKGILQSIDEVLTGFKNVKVIESNLDYLSLRYDVIVLEITQGLETQGFRLIIDRDKDEIIEISLVWEW
nr:MAG TPA: hypothetical protein [Caudoviricetes sp.]